MKLIDADKLIEKLSAGLDNPEELPVISIGTVMRMIDSEEEIHTSQQEIIHCGECTHYKIDHPKANGYHCCYRCHNIFPMKEDDFCSRSERRTDENN